MRIFDYTKFDESFRDELRENAEWLAAEAGIAIEIIRKEGRGKEILARPLCRSNGERIALGFVESAVNQVVSGR